ncbi:MULTISPECIES: CDF family Co(II)/Ni(II) efflux transporter DmeF [unclassified Janthinobacterium]|uniref:CDF family Co(II)/Ni(II) efflux transporter DmeF n=1 Tax=unclassified Janthinobacterium TaxID=2610881 RepID=UPI00160E59AD|nr:MULTISPECIES: CDF family Co(II)/Ni(II) efflux transporter DmeF [unclassified Janthinobacterium]MBB5368981.1 cation diffusion facilitator family transporter [Janthinobacterium sp. K2C7]MBB5381483.1 cation diffusion facilitator family transporter [Janthinobacterium sp. K2Li3]MBB5387363.1 cation diffusion facilitator family transporter [Janthinobacterium sp. K2E3]
MRYHASREDLSAWQHEHVFGGASVKAESRARIVMWITLATMVLEIVAGWWYNSMALQADGWHMSSHAVAIGLTAFAYAAARRYARDPRFAFGTWKIEILAGYTSAILLVVVAVLMVAASLERLFSPQPIHYPEAMAVAAFGLLVNLVCALLLGGKHDHEHGHDHDHHEHHAHEGHGEDLNMKAAYVHVLADAATSVLAIVALAGAWAYGWNWLDPVMGILGAVLVALWAKKLMRDTAKVLLDREMDHPVVAEIREAVEVDSGGDTPRIVDLHVWRVGKQLYSCALSVVSRDPGLTAGDLRARIAIHEEIVHSTIEIVRRS